jgi:hypothetical protein
MGTHFGAARTQNAQGHLLGHVRDLGLRSDDPNVRIYQTAERQTFHTDSCDIVGLLCLQVAKSGGDSALVSSNTIWNEMRRRRPDLAALLLQPVATDRRGEVPAGEQPFFTIPVFNWHEGGMSAIYQRQYIESAQRFEDAPRLDERWHEALDLLDELANDPALNFLMTLQRGDIQLVHNHTLLHDRTAFENWPQPERQRHLLRLWLAPDDARPLPAVFAQRFGSVVPGSRGGVGAVNAAPTGPHPRGTPPALFKRDSSAIRARSKGCAIPVEAPLRPRKPPSTCLAQTSGIVAPPESASCPCPCRSCSINWTPGPVPKPCCGNARSGWSACAPR